LTVATSFEEVVAPFQASSAVAQPEYISQDYSYEQSDQ
jgi:hypothetical protein